MTAAPSAVPAIAADLERIEGLVARARADVDGGALIDLTRLDGRIREVCARIEGLPGGEGPAFRSRLLALYDDLGSLTEAIRRSVEALETTLGDNAKRRKAVSAYGQPRAGKGPSES